LAFSVDEIVKKLQIHPTQRYSTQPNPTHEYTFPALTESLHDGEILAKRLFLLSLPV